MLMQLTAVNDAIQVKVVHPQSNVTSSAQHRQQRSSW
jgi:hypothetical protein